MSSSTQAIRFLSTPGTLTGGLVLLPPAQVSQFKLDFALAHSVAILVEAFGSPQLQTLPSGSSQLEAACRDTAYWISHKLWTMSGHFAAVPPTPLLAYRCESTTCATCEAPDRG